MIESVGAGGGTIARIDEFGDLKSGPRSAGADPGPACYGRGGENATTTDAHVFLGRIDPKMFLGGNMALQSELAKDALGRLAEKFGHDVTETALGMLRITDSNMEKAIRKVSIERGFDPREFSLVAFGGAGPLHCLSIAKEMSIGEVIIPPMPGLTSALGLLYTDIKHDYTKTYNKAQDKMKPEEVESLFQEAEKALFQNLEKEGYASDKIVTRRRLHMRYLGGFEPYSIQVGLPDRDFTQQTFGRAIEQFNVLHEKEFKYSLKDHPVVVEMLGVEGMAITAKPPFRAETLGPTDASAAVRETRQVYFEGGSLSSKVYDRRRLHSGAEVAGPAIVEQMDSTTLIPPGLVARVDQFRNLRVNVSGGSAGQ
jgi:N-methylhydantoinase A